MQTLYANLPAGTLAYVRRIDPETLPAEIRTQIPGGAQVWGLHAPDGACIALTGDRRSAFFVAREHDLTPVSAH